MHPVAHPSIVVTLRKSAQTPGTIYTEPYRGRMRVPYDSRVLERSRRLLEVVAAGAVNVRGTVMDNGMRTDLQPIRMLLGHHQAIRLKDLVEGVDEEAGELRVLTAEAEDEVFVISPEELHSLFRQLLGEAAGLAREQSLEELPAFLQLLLEIHARGFIRVMRIEGSAVEDVTVEHQLIGFVGVDYGVYPLRGRPRQVQIRHHHRPAGGLLVAEAVDDRVLRDGVGDIVFDVDAPLQHLAVIEDDISALPQGLVHLVLAVFVIGILVGGSYREVFTAAENEPVDGGYHMRIRQRTRRRYEVGVIGIGCGSYRKLMPRAVHDLSAGKEHRIELADGGLDVRSDVFLITQDDVTDDDTVLHDIVTVSALLIEILEFVLDRHKSDRDSEGSYEVGDDVLIVQVVSEDNDAVEGFSGNEVLKKLEDALGSVRTEGVSDDEVLGFGIEFDRFGSEVTELLQALFGGILDVLELPNLYVEIEVLVVLLPVNGAEVLGIPVNEVEIDGDQVLHIGLEVLGVTAGAESALCVVARSADIAAAADLSVVVVREVLDGLLTTTLRAFLRQHVLLLSARAGVISCDLRIR